MALTKVIDDPGALRRILELMAEGEKDDRLRQAYNAKRDELQNDIVNKFLSGTFFDGRANPQRVRVDHNLEMRRLPSKEEYPLPAGSSRFYGDLNFEYTDRDDGFNMFTQPAFKTSFEFCVCSHALLDLRYRDRDTENPGNIYGSNWILVGIPKTTLHSLRDTISPIVTRKGYRFDITNFKETNDHAYVTTVANLKVDPRFVEITRLGEDHEHPEATLGQTVVGQLKEVYTDQVKSGVHKGFLIFDPFLMAEVSDEDNEPTLCKLKFRLVGIRSFGESRENASYFPSLDLL